MVKVHFCSEFSICWNADIHFKANIFVWFCKATVILIEYSKCLWISDLKETFGEIYSDDRQIEVSES